MTENERAILQVNVINNLVDELKEINEKLERLDRITRHSPRSKIFTRKGKVFASTQPPSDTSYYEVELRSTDLMLLESALEEQRDRVQSDLDKQLKYVNTNVRR